MQLQSIFRRAGACAFLLTCGALWGCGGGNSSSTPTSGTGSNARADDFILQTVAPANTPVDVIPGGSADVALLLKSVNGFKSTVKLTATPPVGWTVTFTPNNIKLPAGDTPVTMHVTVPATATGGTTANVAYKAEGGGLTRYNSPGVYFNPDNSATTFNIVGTALTAPAALTLSSSVGGFTSSVDSAGVGVAVVSAGAGGTVTPSITGLPAGVTATFDTPTTTLPTNGIPVAVNFTLINTTGVSPGTYPIAVTFVNGGKTVTSPTINLIVSSDATITNLLTVSGATANTTLLQNGPFAGSLSGAKLTGSVSVNGTSFPGEHILAINKSGALLSLDLLGLPLNSGTNYDLATAQNIVVEYKENGKVFVATSGTVRVVSVTEKAVRVTVENARFLSASSTATGEFILNGSATYPITLVQ